MQFSNSVTVEHNVLSGVSVGKILRHREYSATTGAAAGDRFFHYDPVGSVMAESDSAGAGASRRASGNHGRLKSVRENGAKRRE